MVFIGDISVVIHHPRNGFVCQSANRIARTGTVDHILLGCIDILIVHDLIAAFETGQGTESPAGTISALITHNGNVTGLSQVQTALARTAINISGGSQG